MSDAFISYSRTNDEFAARLEAALLAADPPQTIWRDKSGLGPGVKWRPEVQEGIATSENFIFIITPESVRDTIPAPGANLRPCGFEIEHAVSLGKRIVPIMLEYAPSATFHPAVRECNYIDFRDPANFDAAFAKLLTALHTDTAWLHAHTRLQNRASDWQSNNRDRSYLLTGADLTEAEHWLAQPADTHAGLKPTPLETEFIATSRTSETRSQKLRTRIAIAVATVSIVLAASALIQRHTAKEQARIATAGRIAATALSLRDTQLDLAALLSVEALREADTFDTRNAQLILFQTAPNLFTHLHLTNPKNEDFDCVADIAFRHDGKQFATGSCNGTIEFWDTATLQNISTFPHPGKTIQKLAFSPDDTLLGVIYESGQAELWRISGPQPTILPPLPNAPAEPSSLAFDRTGTLFAVGGDGGIQVWVLKTMQPLRKLSSDATSVESVVFSPADPTLLIYTTDNAIHFENSVTAAARGQVVSTKTAPAGSDDLGFTDLAISPDGTQIAVDHGRNQVEIYQLTSNAQRITASLRSQLPNADDGIVMGIAYSPDGTRLVESSNHGAMREWSLPSLKPLRDYPASLAVTNYSVAYGPHGQLFSGLKSGSILIWDETHSGIHTVSAPGLEFSAFTPDSTHLLLAGKNAATGSWDIAAAKLTTPATSQPPIYTVTISGPNIELRRNGQFVTLLPNPPAITQTAIVTPDGQFAAATAFADAGEENTSIQSRMLWDLRSGTPKAIPLRGPDYGTFGLAFNPTATRLATTGFKGLFLWNTANGKLDGYQVEPNRKPVLNAAFNPAGNLIALYVDDGQVILVDLSTLTPFGLPLQQDIHSNDAEAKIAFSPNGKLLAFEGPQHSTLLFNADPESWADRPCRLANRNLTLAEWNRYIGPSIPYHPTCPNP